MTPFVLVRSMRTALVAVLFILLVPGTVAGSEGAAPRAGDAVEYVLKTVDGEQRVVLEWSVEPVWLPTGETRELATLTASSLQPFRAVSARTGANPFADDAVVRRASNATAVHWTTFPGEAVAWSVSWMDDTDGDGRWATETGLGGCDAGAEILAWVDASCPFTGDVERALPVGLPSRVSTAAWTLEAVSFRRGLASLPSDATPLRALPSVEWTTWSGRGPAHGDLAAHPFSAARDALAKEPDAARWMLAHPDAPILQARYVASTTAEHRADPWGHRLKGVPCTATETERIPGSEWSAAWIDDDGSLFALVQRAGAVVPLDRVLGVNDDGYATRHVGGPPARVAPTPESLARHLPLLGGKGDVATVDYDFLPTGAVASASRGTCTFDAATGRMSYTGASLVFRERDVRALRFEAARDRPVLPIGFAPTTTAPGGISAAEGSPATVAMATAAVGLAAVVVAVLYSRVRSDAVLSHPKRARVFARIRDTPGGTVQDVARALGLPRNTVEHHVRTLARNGYVRISDGPRGKVLTVTSERVPDHAALLARAHAAELLAALRDRPGMTQQELAALVGMRKGHLSSLVRDLAAAGLVVRERRGRAVHVTAIDGSGRS